jgi:tripeptidyl-peptidase I
MGVTMLFSSGDEGVGGDTCLFPNGTQSAAAKGFNPSFPSVSFTTEVITVELTLFAGTCPFVTSVGATQVVAGHKVSAPQKYSEMRHRVMLDLGD